MPEARQTTKRDVFVLDATFGLVGRLDGVHVDPDGEAWGTVHCGTFGSRSRLVPLRGAHWWSGYLRVPCTRHQVRTAPEIPGGVLLSDQDAERLSAHYEAVPDDEPRFHRPSSRD